MRLVSILQLIMISAMCLLLAAACTAGGQSDNSLSQNSSVQEQMVVPLGESLPEAVPANGELPAFPAERSGLGITDYVALGSDAELVNSSAAISGTELLLLPHNGGTAWGMWRFRPHGGYIERLDVLLSLSKGEEAWVALPDYVSGRWTFRGPFSKSEGMAINRQRNVSPDGNLYAVVVVHGSNMAAVKALSLRIYSSDGVPPLAQLSADEEAGNAPLTVNFDASASADPQGEISHYLWDFDGDGAFEGLSFEPGIAHEYREGGLFNATVAVVDNDGDAAEASVEINVNSPPQAVLSASDLSVAMGETVFFSTHGSNDVDGTIVDYRWDLNGDGHFNQSATEKSFLGSPVAEDDRYYLKDWRVQVELIDDKGARAIATVSVFVHGFESNLVYGLSLISGGISVVNHDKKLIFVYSSEDHELRTSVTPDHGLWSGEFEHASIAPHKLRHGAPCDLEIIDDRPALLHLSANDSSLRYAVSNSSDGLGPEGWSSITFVEDATGLESMSLAPSPKYPAVTYSLNSNSVVFRKSSSPDGSELESWSDPVVFDDAKQATLFSLHGDPTFAANSAGVLEIFFNIDGEDPTVWESQIIGEALNPIAIELNRLAYGNGNALVYALEGSGQVVFASSQSLPGQWDQSTVAQSHDISDVQLEIIDHCPCVVYRDGSDLVVCWSRNVEATAGWDTFWSVKQGSTDPATFAVCSFDRKPAIAYKDGASLLLARLI